jgi:protein-S-isoprenylcysteine O-methyltransferase Ste14
MAFAIRIDAKTLPALIFCGVLVAVAIGLCIFVWRARQALQSIVENDDKARLQADRQFWRRIQISMMLAVVGILIAVGDQLDQQVFGQRPLLFLAWVLGIFVLVTWMVLLALGDWLSTVAYSSVALSRLRHERSDLEDEIRRYQAMKNGRLSDDEHDQYPTEIFP